MNTSGLSTLSELFYDSYRIPICCCDPEMQFCVWHPGEIPSNVFSEVAASHEAGRSISFFTDQQFLHWGYMKDIRSGNCLLIGPIFSVPLDEQGIRAFMKLHTISNPSFEAIRETFSRIPVMPFQQFLYILRFLYYQINGEVISGDSLVHWLTSEGEDADSYSRSRFYSDTPGETSFADSYRMEQALLYYIESGNVEELRQLASNRDVPMSNIGSTPMSQQKMYGVIIITVIARFVIQKGMDINTAMRLSDLYLQGIDASRNTKELTMLVTNAYIDYAERLQALKIPDTTSPLVFRCVQFIRQTVNAPITASDVAAQVGKSLSYISTKFKNEMGCTLSAFILQSKIEEAKSLLEHTELSIAEISGYLCFSDQSHFHRMFHKITGSTPMQYKRNACPKITF